MSRKIREALAAELGDEVRALQSAVDAFDESAARRLGVNRTDLRCLDVLMRSDSATPGQLAADLGLTTGSVTAMLDRLAKLGYLTRSSDPTDRRKVVVRPTPSALRHGRDIYGPLAAEGARELSNYSETELRLLIDFVRRSRELQERHLTRVRAD